MIEGERQGWHMCPFRCRGDDGRGGFGAYHLWSWPWVDAGREAFASLSCLWACKWCLLLKHVERHRRPEG